MESMAHAEFVVAEVGTEGFVVFCEAGAVDTQTRA